MKHRFEELDTMRGFAALSVVLIHSIAVMFNMPQWLDFSPLHFFWAGHEAVIFFFVLSGFVLTISYAKAARVQYWPFIVKRFFRIYVPYLIAILTTFCLYWLFAGTSFAGLGQWVQKKWSEPPDFSLVFQHILLIGDFNTTIYNPVIWTLVHEMRIAFIFPLLLWLILHLRIGYVLLIAAAFSALNGVNLVLELDVSQGWNTSYINTIHYASFFLIGGLLAKHINVLRERIRNWRTSYKIGLLLVGVFVYTYARSVRILPFEFMEVIADWGISCGVILLMLSALTSRRISIVLHFRPLLWTGKISYSYYLYHSAILLAFYSLLYGIIHPLVITMLTIVFTFVIAYVSYQYIEKPAIRIGNRLLQSSPKPTPKEQ